MIDQARSETRRDHASADPSARAVAGVYADGFLGAVRDVGVNPEEAFEEFESFLDDVLAKNPSFEALLTSQVIGRDQKVDLINRAVAPHASELFANFLRVLARHERLQLLPLILWEARARHEASLGLGRVQVFSAKPLSDEWLGTIRQRLEETLPFKPIIENQVDPSLLGGLIVQVGDTVYDSSLRARMKQLRGRLRQRSLYEIQSGRDRFSHSEGD